MDTNNHHELMKRIMLQLFSSKPRLLSYVEKHSKDFFEKLAVTFWPYGEVTAINAQQLRQLQRFFTHKFEHNEQQLVSEFEIEKKNFDLSLSVMLQPTPILTTVSSIPSNVIYVHLHAVPELVSDFQVEPGVQTYWLASGIEYCIMFYNVDVSDQTRLRPCHALQGRFHLHLVYGKQNEDIFILNETTKFKAKPLSPAAASANSNSMKRKRCSST